MTRRLAIRMAAILLAAIVLILSQIACGTGIENIMPAIVGGMR